MVPRLCSRHPCRIVLSLLLGSAGLGAPGGAIAQEFQLRNPTIANGGAVLEAGPYRLYVTIGEPAASRIARDAFVLTSGLQATFLNGAGQPPPDSVFADGFEVPAPNAALSGERP